MSARRAFISLGLALSIAACAQPANPPAAAAPAVDSAAVTAAIADLWSRWISADTAGNTAALVEMVADSARLDVRGMPPMLGRAAWKTMVEAGYKTTKYTSMTIVPDKTIPISNEMAYQNGSYTEGSTTQGKSYMDYGRYASALRKDPDGQWRIAYIMVFSDSMPVKK
ncbi:MAG TPA: nuclear transport factor 2 family protein [Gemmatimonadales bacterium]|jgi:uncharacterized protein (TIGR02246 family)|nr:nuclear transport factor 2 family protein [Gemmatimonadales bacterium]